jgi:hypothetical protein
LYRHFHVDQGFAATLVAVSLAVALATTLAVGKRSFFSFLLLAHPFFVQVLPYPSFSTILASRLVAASVSSCVA